MARRAVVLAVVLLAVLAATAGAKRVVGTPRADVLRGTGGSDVLQGRGGDDLLDGRSGRDRLSAGAGRDRVQAFDGARDRVSCGAGEDLAAADGADAVAPDCELVSRQISRDRLRGRPGQHESQVEPHAASNGSTIVATFQVARIQDGGAMAIGWATSTDGGRTWRSGLLPRLTAAARPAGAWDRASDPVVAYDARHRTWLIATLALDVSPGRSALAVSRSPDGLSWREPLIVDSGTGLAFDKEWIVCDNWPGSAFRGRCYLSYSDLETDQIATRFSSDGGVTWSRPVSPPPAADRPEPPRDSTGVQPVARPNADVVIVYYADERYEAVRSTDGGATYSAPVTVASVVFDQPPGLRAPPFASVAVDAAGAVYAVWPDCRRRTACRGNDLLLARSVDGVAWSTPVALAVNQAADSVLPALAADGDVPGRLAVTYYLRSGDRLGVRLTGSPDGGRTWTRPVRLDAEQLRFSWVADANGAMVGDYFGTAFAAGHPVAIFSLAGRPSRGRLNQGIFAAVVTRERGGTQGSPTSPLLNAYALPAVWLWRAKPASADRVAMRRNRRSE